MAQTPALLFSEDGTIDYTPSSAVTGGDIVVIGTIICVAPVDIAANTKGALHTQGIFKFPKTTDTFTAGDAVYWDVDGNPVTGDAGTGAADSSAATGNLAGWATADAATGDTYVYVELNASKRVATVAGSVTADDITGSDSSLGISGLAAAQGGSIALVGGTSSTSANAGGALTRVGGTPGATGVGGAITDTGGAGGSTSGAGGAVSRVGGAGTAGNAAGGAISDTGGAGQGSAAGGALSYTGGAGGATGAGGAVAITAGAGGATSGTGGAVTIAAGAGTAGNANGGALSVLAGNAHGSGTDGTLSLGTSNTSAITIGAAAIVTRNAGHFQKGGNAAVTATVGGGTTGLIPAGASFVTVTSDNADKQISLPAGTIGDEIEILVGTTACELISAVAADKVNEVTVGATNELALTAESLYRCKYTKSGFWIVTGLTKLGAAEAALVPDAL